MHNLINRITSLAITVSQTTPHDIFVRYQGHVNQFQVDIHENGFAANKYPTRQFTIWLDLSTLEHKIKSLYEIKKAIEGLKNE